MVAHRCEDAVLRREFLEQVEHRPDHGGILVHEITRQHDEIRLFTIERGHRFFEQGFVLIRLEMDVRHQADAQAIKRGGQTRRRKFPHASH